MAATFSEIADEIAQAQQQIRLLQSTGNPVRDANNAMRVAGNTLETIRNVIRQVRAGKLSDQGALFAIEELLGV